MYLRPSLQDLIYTLTPDPNTRLDLTAAVVFQGDLLMEQGCCLLVYPGGAREAWKRTTDKPYDILWGYLHALATVAECEHTRDLPLLSCLSLDFLYFLLQPTQR